jgi:hypothetical protein
VRLPSKDITSLRNILTKFANQGLPSLNEGYKWPIPTALPSGIDLPAGSLYEQSLALKSRLHEQWLVANPEQRFVLAKFYVSTWGGVKRNADEKLRSYAAQEPRSIMGDGIKGIASWSKVLSIRDPSKYAIYDARVAAALNCVQVVEGVRRGILFPLLPSQNKLIQTATPCMRAHARANEWVNLDETLCYETYLALLAAVAKRCDMSRAKIVAVEMLLFSRAEKLVERAFPHVHEP